MAVLPMRVYALTFLTAILAILVAGCGGGGNGGGSGHDQNVVVSVSPRSADVFVLSQNCPSNCGVQQFQATVTGGETNAVDWLVNGIPGGNSSVGTISSSGLYTPPNEIPQGQITVSARSLANTSKTDSATVNLKYPVAESISVTPRKIKQGSGPISVTVNSPNSGSFSKFATATANGTPLSISTISQTSATVTIPASLTGDENTLLITVQNPTPGGGGTGTPLFVVLGSFAALPDMHTPRTDHTATLLQDGRVLITGGSDANGGILNSAELFDPATNIFQVTSSMNSARTGHSATLLADGTVLVAGGFGNKSTVLPNLNTAEIYNPATNSFTPVPSAMNSPHSKFAARLSNGKVLLQDEDADVYDPSAMTFTAVSSNDTIRFAFTPPSQLLPGQAVCPGLVVLPDGNAIVLAGPPYQFDPNTLNYTPLTDGTSNFSAKYNCAYAVLHTGEILTSGGGSNSFDLVNGGRVWNPSSLTITDSFTFVQPPFGLTRQVDVTLSNGLVLMFTPAPMIRADLYDPARRGLSFIGPDPLPLTPSPPPSVIATPTATLLNDGRVLILGLKAQVYLPQ